MILKHLRINNVFSYCGEHELDLMPPSDGRNIVIIHGRNGQGKTSLLNALKLLIGGITDELRSSAVTSRTLSIHQYVLGAPDDWLGIFNRKALSAGDLVAEVEGIFLQSGRQLNIRRRWEKDGSPQGYHYQSFIQFVDLERDSDDDASEFLEEHFPPEFVPLFLFDGELVQRMAEDMNAGRVEAVKALLELTPYDVLEKNLRELAREAERQGADENTLQELKNVRTQLESLKGDLKVKQALLKRRESELKAVTGELKELENELELLAVEGAESKGTVTLQEKRALEKRLQRLQEDVLRVMRSGPSAFASSLRTLAGQKLDEMAKVNVDRVEAQIELLDHLKRLLPLSVLRSNKTPSPKPEPHVLDFYEQRLLKVLDEERPELHVGGLQLTAAFRGSLAERLNTLNAAQTSTALKPFKELVEVRRELHSVRSRLEAFDSQKEEDRARRVQLIQQQQEKLREQGRLELETDTIKEELPRLSNRIASEERNRQQLEARRDALVLTQQKAERLATLHRFTVEYQKLCQDTRRKQLEEGVTQHFFQLFDSNKMIERIRISPNFGLTLEGARGIPVARGSISAGMKQLVAISLLWTLMELSGRRALVAVDTPLARLDRSHQSKILQRYLPAVSTQVLLLPTDSELPPDRYNDLKPYVYKEFRLQNAAGDSTRIEEEPLAQSGVGPKGIPA